MTTLYELSAEWRDCMGDAIDPETGEVSDDLEDRLTAMDGELAEKIEAVAQYRAGVLADAEAFKEEAARLTERRKTAERKAERLRDYLGACLALLDTRKVQTRTHVVSIRKTSPKVVLDVDAIDLPACYQVMAAPRANLSELKASLKIGDARAAECAHLESGETVSVR